MTRRLYTAAVIQVLLIALITVTPSLFVELFKNADQIAVKHEPTAGGVRVIETSKDAYVVKLLHAHAEVVSAFLANGMSEMMKNHPVPPR